MFIFVSRQPILERTWHTRKCSRNICWLYLRTEGGLFWHPLCQKVLSGSFLPHRYVRGAAQGDAEHLLCKQQLLTCCWTGTCCTTCVGTAAWLATDVCKVTVEPVSDPVSDVCMMVSEIIKTESLKCSSSMTRRITVFLTSYTETNFLPPPNMLSWWMVIMHGYNHVDHF